MSTNGIEKRPLLVELPIRVKTYDIDFIGHVNNIVYIRWLEDLRLHFLDAHLPLEELRESGIVPVIVNTEIHYRQGIVLSDRMVRGRIWVRELGRAVFHLSAEFHVGDELRCSASQRGSFINAEKMRPARIPKDFHEKFRIENEA